MTGPLGGIRILEFTGIGPGPFCGMMLADHGAEVIRIDRMGPRAAPETPLDRNRRSICINMKNEKGVALARRLAKTADGVIEGFRPGVMERLGLGPDELLKDNPELVYGRMTGWGQYGPYADRAGHDINYIALSGVLHGCSRAGEKPVPPVNYLGDFGGGGMMLAFGMVSALLAVKNGAKGQVIDCAMTDGSALLSSLIWGLRNQSLWRDERGVNLLDTGAPFYDVYETKDEKFVAIGAIEPAFYNILRQRIGLENEPDFDAQLEQSKWPALKSRMQAVFHTKTRDEWCAILEHTDACFAPVLSMEEAKNHPHNIERETFLDIEGNAQPAPAPRYSKTKLEKPKKPAPPGADTQTILTDIGVDALEVKALIDSGAIA
ncbi:MAG: CaiB/BaiF CoA-transferase family protein [Pseudomonadota bacterium]